MASFADAFAETEAQINPDFGMPGFSIPGNDPGIDPALAALLTPPNQQSAVNALNPNPLQIAGAGITASPIGGFIQTDDRLTTLGDAFANAFGSGQDGPFAGVLDQSAVSSGGLGTDGPGLPGLGFDGPGTPGFGDGPPDPPEAIPGGVDPGGVPGAPGTEVPGDGTGTGTGDGTAADGSLSSQAQKILDEAALSRTQFATQFGDLLSGRFDPATSPAFVAQREAIEDQFRTAEDEIRSKLPAGGPLNSALVRLSAAKGRAVSDTLSGILSGERDKAFQFATGQTGLGLGALEGAERLDLSELLGKEGLNLQKQALENAIEQAAKDRENQTTSDTVEFILNLLGI